MSNAGPFRGDTTGLLARRDELLAAWRAPLEARERVIAGIASHRRARAAAAAVMVCTFLALALIGALDYAGLGLPGLGESVIIGLFIAPAPAALLMYVMVRRASTAVTARALAGMAATSADVAADIDRLSRPRRSWLAERAARVERASVFWPVAAFGMILTLCTSLLTALTVVSKAEGVAVATYVVGGAALLGVPVQLGSVIYAMTVAPAIARTPTAELGVRRRSPWLWAWLVLLVAVIVLLVVGHALVAVAAGVTLVQAWIVRSAARNYRHNVVLKERLAIEHA